MIQYYLLYPNQTKDDINYDKQLVAESGGFKTVYLKTHYKHLIEGLSVVPLDEFKKLVCDPDDLIVFDNKGKEYNLDEFADHLKSKYEYVKNDF